MHSRSARPCKGGGGWGGCKGHLVHPNHQPATTLFSKTGQLALPVCGLTPNFGESLRLTWGTGKCVQCAQTHAGGLGNLANVGDTNAVLQNCRNCQKSKFPRPKMAQNWQNSAWDVTAFLPCCPVSNLAQNASDQTPKLKIRISLSSTFFAAAVGTAGPKFTTAASKVAKTQPIHMPPNLVRPVFGVFAC